MPLSLTPIIRKILRRNGFYLSCSRKGNFQIWRHRETGKHVSVDAKILSLPNANKIMRDAGLPKVF